jgi:hypothetical protein
MELSGTHYQEACRTILLNCSICFVRMERQTELSDTHYQEACRTILLNCIRCFARMERLMELSGTHYQEACRTILLNWCICFVRMERLMELSGTHYQEACRTCRSMCEIYSSLSGRKNDKRLFAHGNPLYFLNIICTHLDPALLHTLCICTTTASDLILKIAY